MLTMIILIGTEGSIREEQRSPIEGEEERHARILGEQKRTVKELCLTGSPQDFPRNYLQE